MTMDFRSVEEMSAIYAEMYCEDCSARVENCCMNMEAVISNETLEYCHRYNADCKQAIKIGECLFHNMKEWIWYYDYII